MSLLLGQNLAAFKVLIYDPARQHGLMFGQKPEIIVLYGVANKFNILMALRVEIFYRELQAGWEFTQMQQAALLPDVLTANGYTLTKLSKRQNLPVFHLGELPERFKEFV